jgi:hypothetical protein
MSVVDITEFLILEISAALGRCINYLWCLRHGSVAMERSPYFCEEGNRLVTSLPFEMGTYS